MPDRDNLHLAQFVTEAEGSESQIVFSNLLVRRYFANNQLGALELRPSSEEHDERGSTNACQRIATD